MVTLREMHAILQRLEYPATKEELIEQARHLGAPEAVLERLRGLPEHYYGSTNTVMDALRGPE